MAEKRRALGRGLGALIPSGPSTGAGRPIDVFFPDQRGTGAVPATSGEATATAVPDGDVTREAALDATAAVIEQAESSVQPDGAAPGTDLAPVPGAEFAEIPVTAIRPNPKQPRTVFDEDQLAELVHSIKEIGILQPIVVRRVTAAADGAEEGIEFELNMGERRWRASKEAGFELIPAIIKDTKDDDLLRDALLENLHRSQLNALEEAAAYQQLLDDFGCTQEELATRIGRSRPQISNTLRLLKLPPLVQRRVAAGVLSAGHARARLGMTDGGAMERMAQRIVAEGLSVRTVEEIVALGDADTPAKPRRPRAGNRHPQLEDFSAALADRLDTRVGISLGQRKGKVTVEFASVEDLRRILALMGIEEVA
ncbi:MAG: ParB/RepB/Spo0J family partition protein [Intrasporangium sp.]|uniref:ParB/RepB/Spo0J family partition protein n=1 Tax=Intrasporangium sp. TaxID=1925024 RepID=UPI003F82219A